jgi:hypothetical protein
MDIGYATVQGSGAFEAKYRFNEVAGVVDV